MRALVVLCLLSLGLAGCSEDSAPATDDGACPAGTFDNGEGLCLIPTEDTGIIRGVVVDAAVVPVEGALVELVGAGQTVTTGADGVFGFGDLQPRFYELQSSKFGYDTVQVQTNVEIDDEPSFVKVLMPAIAGFAPFSNLLQWEGYIQCNTTNANLCLILNYYPDFVLGTGPILPDTSHHLFYDEFVSVGRVPQHTQLETVWESTQPLGSALTLRVQGDRPDTLLIDCPGFATEGASPLIVRVNETVATGWGIGEPLAEDPDLEDRCDPTSANGVGIEFFSGDAGFCQATPVGCVPRLGATVEQQVTMFVAAFYDFAPPQEWIFIEDGAYTP